ncbi:MAG: hypothetical protein RID53_04470 [Coleofasciculus sp. B1-GNL1-01]|uniref:hypothetical protein n=1 Tax=Coleofasciculus sp. B1-GNL1-01 TaxID=3068484 RepID=UPI0032F263DF
MPLQLCQQEIGEEADVPVPDESLAIALWGIASARLAVLRFFALLIGVSLSI